MQLTDEQKRAECAASNDKALFVLMGEHSIKISPREIAEWRPCRRSVGDIPGVREGLTILCTNGVVAWFTTQDSTLVFGHISHFTGKVAPLFSVPKLSDGKRVVKKKLINSRGADGTLPSKSRTTNVDAALALLLA